MHLYTERSEAHSTSPWKEGEGGDKTAPYFLRNRGQKKERLPVEKCAGEKKKTFFLFTRVVAAYAPWRRYPPLISILIEKGFSSSEASW